MIHFNCHLQVSLDPNFFFVLKLNAWLWRSSYAVGGVWQIGSTYAFRGVSPNSTNMYKGRVGVFFSYILYGSAEMIHKKCELCIAKHFAVMKCYEFPKVWPWCNVSCQWIVWATVTIKHKLSRQPRLHHFLCEKFPNNQYFQNILYVIIRKSSATSFPQLLKCS